MMMTGHQTRSVFERHNIVSQGDLDEAARAEARCGGQFARRIDPPWPQGSLSRLMHPEPVTAGPGGDGAGLPGQVVAELDAILHVRQGVSGRARTPPTHTRAQSHLRRVPVRPYCFLLATTPVTLQVRS